MLLLAHPVLAKVSTGLGRCKDILHPTYTGLPHGKGAGGSGARVLRWLREKH